MGEDLTLYGQVLVPPSLPPPRPQLQPPEKRARNFIRFGKRASHGEEGGRERRGAPRRRMANFLRFGREARGRGEVV